jgi:hypothetical protein
MGTGNTYSIALGRVIEASLSSSLMCAPASGPMKHQMGDESPIKHDKPVLDQPPPLLDFVSDNSFCIDLQPESLLEICEDVLCWSMLGHDPERQQEREEPEDM